MKSITLYDPAMCCSTGVCGPSVDPELVRVSRDMDKLKQAGIETKRFNLGQEPQAFLENSEVAALLAEDTDVLPITVVEGKVRKTQAYPTAAELSDWFGVTLNGHVASGSLSEQVKELIAIGAAIAANCEPCFKAHYAKARKLGVTKEQMIEAVEVGDAVKNASARNILTLAERYLVGGTVSLSTVDEPCCGGSNDDACC